MNPLSFIAEYSYCPRSAFWLLTKAPRYRDENEYIQDGRDAHATLQEKYFRSNKEKSTQSEVRIFSENFHISGKIDVLEIYKSSKQIIPIEFKRGKTRVNHMHHMQLFLMAICLEEMLPNTTITKGGIFFTGDRKKQEIEITTENKNQAKHLAQTVWEKINKGVYPKDFPMQKDERCKGCCFWDLCYI